MSFLISGDSTQSREGNGDLSWLKGGNSLGRGGQPAGVEGRAVLRTVCSPELCFSCLWLKATGQDGVFIADNMNNLGDIPESRGFLSPLLWDVT